MNEKRPSQRRACALVGIAPRVHRYAPGRADDAGLRERLKELSSERRRFGDLRLHILLKREGVEANWKRPYRIYKEEKLAVRKRGGRKRALGTRAPMAIPQGANQRWSLDFVSDALVDGRRFRILCVIDDPRIKSEGRLSAASALPQSSTTRCPASGSPVNWMPSPKGAGIPA
jgi:putative transposase